MNPREQSIEMWKNVMSDLSRLSGIEMDDMDAKEYTNALRPLQQAIVNQRPSELKQPLTHESPEVWRLRYWIRNQKFRPNYEEVANKVLDVLGMPRTHGVPGHVVDAQKVYKAEPAPVNRQLGDKQYDLFSWTNELKPSGEDDRDELIAKMLTTIESIYGSGEAVHVAKSINANNMLMKADEAEMLQSVVEKIPEEERSQWIRRAGGMEGKKYFVQLGVAREALSLYTKSKRTTNADQGMQIWREKWHKPKKDGV
jgi:hypothetical protein